MINRDMKTTLIAGIGITVTATIICAIIDMRCGAICLVSGIAITTIFVICTKERYKKMAELNDYLAAVCAGNYDLDIADNTEGEMSILKNNLYKVISILRTQNEMLKKDKIYLADSLADISHQIKTPLTSIMVMTDLLKDEKDGQKRSEFISIIESQLDKTKWLITNLLKMSKIDAQTVVMKKEMHLASDIIQAATEPFLLMLELKNITMVNHTDDYEINVDKGWTTEAIQNIIKNCIEHTPKDGTITVETHHTNIYDEICISDNGCGIAEDDLPHIFERFYHGKNSSGDSVGIGLALAKTILEKQNAEISATSKEGDGTRFSIKFYKAII